MRFQLFAIIAITIVGTPALAQMGGGGGGGSMGSGPQSFDPSSSPSHSPMTPVQIEHWKACQTMAPDAMAADKKCMSLKKRADWDARHNIDHG